MNLNFTSVLAFGHRSIVGFFDKVHRLPKETERLEKAIQGACCCILNNIIADSIFSLAEKCWYYPYTKIIQQAYSSPEKLTLVEKVVVLPFLPIIDFATCIYTPACEEVLFREVIQRSLLRDQVASLLNRISPDLGEVVDHRAMKVMRVCLAAGLFSLYHIQNLPYYTEEQVMHQIFNTAIMGIALGTTRETLGLFPTVVAHIIHNSAWTLNYQVNNLLLQ